MCTFGQSKAHDSSAGPRVKGVSGGLTLGQVERDPFFGERAGKTSRSPDMSPSDISSYGDNHDA